MAIRMVFTFYTRLYFSLNILLSATFIGLMWPALLADVPAALAAVFVLGLI
jgi:hypothetical protein